MSDFRVSQIPSSSILHMYSLRESIWFDPPYQRMSDVRPMDKRQLLIDSILNGDDVPKLYFHEFFPALMVRSSSMRLSMASKGLRRYFHLSKGDLNLMMKWNSSAIPP